MSVTPSPVVALSRASAVAQSDGPASALAALRAIGDVERLSAYPFYPAALGELELRLGNYAAAGRHFEAAFALSRNDAERRFLEKRRSAASHWRGGAAAGCSASWKSKPYATTTYSSDCKRPPRSIGMSRS